MKTVKATQVIAALFLLVASAAAHAWDAGDWQIRLGTSTVNPKSNNHEVVAVDDASSLTVSFSYMFNENLAFEVLAAYPFEHGITLHDGTRVGKTKHLPPTFSMKYHFNEEGNFRPYVGAGLNYTMFFSEHTEGPLAGSDLKLDDSFGFALELGADYLINDQWFVNVSARTMDIETDATLDGADLGTVDIDPRVYGLHLGFRF